MERCSADSIVLSIGNRNTTLRLSEGPGFDSRLSIDKGEKVLYHEICGRRCPTAEMVARCIYPTLVQGIALICWLLAWV